MTAAEVLREVEDKYETARCSLPDCGEELYISLHSSRAIYLSDTAADLSEAVNAHTTTWEVTCGGGHTILLPPPTAADTYVFGECDAICETEHDPTCSARDLERLRKVIVGAEPAAKTHAWDECPGCGSDQCNGGCP